MTERGARSRWQIEADLLQRLIIKSCITQSDPVEIDLVKQWFLVFERDMVRVIIEDFTTGDAPVEKCGSNNTKIGVTDLGRAREYRESILQQPEWFEE